jgi:hypothetical protein
LDRGTRRPGDQPRWLISGTSTSASVHGSDRVDRVKTKDVQVKRGSEDLAAGRLRTAVTHVEAGDAYGVRYSRAGLVAWASKPSMAGLQVLASKPGRRFQGRTDDTWRHWGVRVEAKLLTRRRGGHRIKMRPGWTITLLG